MSSAVEAARRLASGRHRVASRCDAEVDEVDEQFTADAADEALRVPVTGRANTRRRHRQIARHDRQTALQSMRHRMRTIHRANSQHVHTVTPDTTRLSCLCRIRFGGGRERGERRGVEERG